MQKYQGKYALVQYCPVPERLEFLNIGLVLIIPELGHLDVRFSKGQSRIERIFGKQSKPYFEGLKVAFGSRLVEQLKGRLDGSGFNEFIARRANGLRLSPLQPILVSDPIGDFSELFEKLVGDQDPVRREPQIRKRLRKAFADHRVEGLLDTPDDVELPEYGLKFSIPFGYQNGCYNLIDGMRLPAQTGEGLREAGKRAMEGNLIWKHFEHGERKRLVVVGDFAQQTDEFYKAVQDQFSAAHVRLYRLDDMRPLLDDIQSQAKLHGRSILN